MYPMVLSVKTKKLRRKLMGATHSSVSVKSECHLGEWWNSQKYNGKIPKELNKLSTHPWLPGEPLACAGKRQESLEETKTKP